MYFLKDKVHEVKSFAVDSGLLYFNTPNYVNEYYSNTRLINSTENLQSLKVENNKIIINTNLGVGYFIEGLNVICLKEPIQYISSDYYITYIRVDAEKNTVIKDIKQSKKIIDIKYSSTIFLVWYNTYFRYNYHEKTIEAFEFPTATFLWKYHLIDLGPYIYNDKEQKAYEVRKFLGIYNERLFVLLSNDEILVLNMQDGSMLEKISQTPPQPMGEYTISVLGNCMLLDTETGKIKGFVNYVYWELDLLTYQFQCYNLATTLHQNGLIGIMNISSYAQSDMHFIVTMKRIDESGSMWSFLVAINRNSKSIEWKQELPWTGNNVPQYSDGKLYQLDTNNTLHIFEKQEDHLN